MPSASHVRSTALTLCGSWASSRTTHQWRRRAASTASARASRRGAALAGFESRSTRSASGVAFVARSLQDPSMTLRRDACRGIWVPLPTPFVGEAGARLDAEALGPMVDWLLARGISGFLALGTTGEAAHCDEDEAAAVVRAAVRAAAGRVPVFAGSGRASARATIVATQSLAAAGADAVLVLTPHVYRARMHGDALVRHYTAVADASPVPVFAYHMPGVTGIDLDADTLASIVRHPNVW